MVVLFRCSGLTKECRRDAEVNVLARESCGQIKSIFESGAKLKWLRCDSGPFNKVG